MLTSTLQQTTLDSSMILETPSLKDGRGRELHRLHDVVLQHLRALKAMEYEPSGPFITSALELKLDTNTMFEWQKHTVEMMCYIAHTFSFSKMVQVKWHSYVLW